MTYKLSVDQPNIGDEGEVYIHGLGTFKNGKSYEISGELEETFRTVNAVDQGGIDDDPESETFGSVRPNVVLGPSLVDAAKSMYGVTVEEIKPQASGAVGGGTGSTTSTNGGGQ